MGNFAIKLNANIQPLNMHVHVARLTAVMLIV